MSQWKSKDGRVTNVWELEDQHLKNIVAMLRRNQYVHTDEFWDSVSMSCSLSSGGMADYYAEQSIVAMRISPKSDALFEEHYKRFKS